MSITYYRPAKLKKNIWPNGFLVVLVLAFIGCSQNSPSASPTPVSTEHSEDSNPILLPVKVSGKWGYINTSGQLTINPQFDSADDFHEGRAVICLGKPCTWWDAPSDSEERWGYIDTSGKMVVTPQYGGASDFNEGLASVCTGDCSANSTKPTNRGYIDRDGKNVIPMQFGIAGNFKEGLAQVCIGTCRWKEKEGYSGKFGFIDHSGHFIINPQYDNAWDFHNGFAKVVVGKGDEAKTGYVDKTGKVVWQPSN
jgi:WG containing repeat